VLGCLGGNDLGQARDHSLDQGKPRASLFGHTVTTSICRWLWLLCWLCLLW
jgi:hypothetical protein